MVIGTINTIDRADNSFSCTVDLGAGDIKTCEMYQDANKVDFLQVGDEVVVVDCGNTKAIVAVFSSFDGSVESGETVIFSRDSGGAIKGKIKLGADGTVNINDGNLEVLL